MVGDRDANLGGFHTEVIIKTMNEIPRQSPEKEEEKLIGKTPWESPTLKG